MNLFYDENIRRNCEMLDAPWSKIFRRKVIGDLRFCEELNYAEDKVKAVFELRSACIAGYSPDLSGCHNCSEVFANRFDISNGTLECARCRDSSSSGIRLPLTTGVLDALRYICYVEPNRMFAFEAGEETISTLGTIAESYLATQLERGFSSLDFYKSIQ